MQLINIFITKRKIAAFSDEAVIQVNSYSLIDSNGQKIPPLTGLATFFQQSEINDNYKVNFFFDQDILVYHHIRLPLVNKSRIAKILEFELDQVMLYDVDEYYYDYCLNIDKELLTSDIGVYAIRKEFCDDLLQLCRGEKFEVHWILSINNLIDIQFCAEFNPNNELYLQIEPKCAKLFVYQNGFFTDYSTVINPSDQSPPNQSISQEYIGLINQKITAILLVNRNIDRITLNTACRSLVKIGDSHLLERVDDLPDDCFLTVFDESMLLGDSLLNHQRRINLLKSSFPLIKEIKKNYKKVVATVAILAGCVVIYMISWGYNLYMDNQQYNHLEQEYAGLISQYLPKGTSKSNAEYILKERLNKLKARQNRNKKYAFREYQNSKLLSQISQIKNEVTTLHIDKIQISEKSTVIRGNVNSRGDFDHFQVQIKGIFPETSFELKTHHKTQGADLVTFSTTIRPL